MTWEVTLVDNSEGIQVAGLRLSCASPRQAAEEAFNVWNPGPGEWGCLVSLVNSNPLEIYHYRVTGKSATFYKAETQPVV